MSMDRRELDVMSALLDRPYTNQRALAASCGLSLGSVNQSLRILSERGYLDQRHTLTEKAERMVRDLAPKNAIILAAGAGMRMVPINMQTSKGLLEVNGETLIERLIVQLQAVGVYDISVVVGFMKEQYEYLIDKYGVELIVNSQYAAKNNLHSLALAAGRLGNSYIVPCDVWCAENPFSRHELYSWYMVADEQVSESDVRVSGRYELEILRPRGPGNRMIGICYLLEEQAAQVRERVRTMCADRRYNDSFWEQALYAGRKLSVRPRIVSGAGAVEINTYEQLRELDSGSAQLDSDAICAAARALNARSEDIAHIGTLKKGMTNRSFIFSCQGGKYIMRVPGEGTDKLIDRRQEAAVYRAIRGRGLCDDPIYLDPDSGYKVTRYIEGVRCCDPQDEGDLVRCMEKLRSFHEMGLTVEHEFDIFAMIGRYESLWAGTPSVYRDHAATKELVLSLRPYIESRRVTRTLTHIDAVPDNFLFGPDGSLQLTDWEYAGMQDPHVDIAMFGIYSLYDRARMDRLIDIYFGGACPEGTRIKIYCYVAACGLLWSDWCEYKRDLGVEFGEYALLQYRYAKQYARLARRMLGMEEQEAARA